MPFYEFKKEFDQLSDMNKYIVYCLITLMEHDTSEFYTDSENCEDNAGRDFKRGFAVARADRGMTEEDLFKEIMKSDDYYKNKIKENEEEDIIDKVKETFKSMSKRKSKNSRTYKSAINILGIDEKFLIENSEYYNRKKEDFEWLYNTLFSRDRLAVCFLVQCLLNPERITKMWSIIESNDKDIPKNIGIE